LREKSPTSKADSIQTAERLFVEASLSFNLDTTRDFATRIPKNRRCRLKQLGRRRKKVWLIQMTGSLLRCLIRETRIHLYALRHRSFSGENF